MNNNPHVQKVGGTMFNLLLVDDWLLGLFRTNDDVWRFLEYLGKQLYSGEPVPSDIWVCTVVTTGTPEIEVLEVAKIIKTELKMPGQEKSTEHFLYTALHGSDTTKIKEVVQEIFPQIMEELYE